MNTEKATHYRIADMLTGTFGSYYTELSEAQTAINSTRVDGTKNYLFVCAVDKFGTLTAI